MRDYYRDGYDKGYSGRERSEEREDRPTTDSDYLSYRSGYKEGERRRSISDQINKELYGDNY